VKTHEITSFTGYVIAYVVLITTALLLIPMPFGIYVILVVAVPSLVLVTLLLISDLLRGRNPQLSGFVRGTLAPSLFIYLLIDAISSMLVTIYHLAIISYLMNFLALVIIGALLIRSSNQYASTRHDVSQSLRYIAYLLIALGLGYLFGAVYKPLFYPFALVSIIYLVLASLTALTGAVDIDINRFLTSSRSLATAVFGIGLFYVVLLIPKPAQWNIYVLIAFVIIASIAITYAGYKLLISGLGNVEVIEDEVYEAHKREIRVVASPEYARLEEAISDFVAHGKKDKIIMYLTHELTKDGLDYEEIMARLDKLINYSSIVKGRGRVSRKLIEMEIRDRANLVNELFKQLYGGGNTNNEGW
jgi:hypothetical protein